MRLSHQYPPSHHIAGVLAGFAAEVKARSTGAVDVQVFPARSGTGIEVAFAAGDLGEVSLFATRRRSSGLVQAAGLATDVEDAGDGATLAWTTRDSAYAVSGGHDAKDLRHAALALAAAP